MDKATESRKGEVTLQTRSTQKTEARLRPRPNLTQQELLHHCGRWEQELAFQWLCSGGPLGRKHSLRGVGGACRCSLLESVWVSYCSGITKRSGLKQHKSGGVWVAQSVKCLTLDLGSGHNLTVGEVEPRVGLCTDSEEPAWDSLSLSAPPRLMHTHVLSLSQTNKQKIPGKLG